MRKRERRNNSVGSACVPRQGRAGGDLPPPPTPHPPTQTRKVRGLSQREELQSTPTSRASARETASWRSTALSSARPSSTYLEGLRDMFEGKAFVSPSGSPARGRGRGNDTTSDFYCRGRGRKGVLCGGINENSDFNEKDGGGGIVPNEIDPKVPVCHVTHGRVDEHWQGWRFRDARAHGARAARLQKNVVVMGVIARRNTWSAARSRAMEVGERWRSNSKVNSIDDGKRIDVETFCDAFSRSTKLRKIVEEDENFSDVDGSSFDCGDIVRLIQLASGEPRAVKAAKMLVGFSRNQQTVIQALENQNRALRDSYGVRLDNEMTRKEVRWTPRALLSSFSNKVLPPPHADVARSPFSPAHS